MAYFAIRSSYHNVISGIFFYLREKRNDKNKDCVYNPEFDSLLTKKVPQTALAAAFGTFVNFLIARYAFGFFVCEQIFLIFFIGTICFEVQKPNASCRASVSSLLV